MNNYAEQAVSFGASLKAAFGGDTAKAAEAANTAILDMADNAAKMGTPIESIQQAYQGFAKGQYQLLDNLKLGYGGTKTEMERLLGDAQKLTGVKYDINNLGDVYEAIHVIQGDLGLTGVAAEEASETLQGSFGAMKAAAENFMGDLALGKDVEKAMADLTDTASTFFFGNFVPMLGTLVKSLPKAALGFIREGVPQLAGGISDLIGDLASEAKNFAEGITAEKVSAWAKTTGVKMLSSGGKALWNFTKGLLGNIGELLGALGKIGLEVVKGLGSALWEKVKAGAEGIKQRFMQPIENLREKVREIVEKIKGFFSFHISPPHIPKPSFGISPAGWKLGDLLKGTIPSLSITWNDMAVDTPRLFTKATLFGAGETSDEIMYGRANLMRDIKEAVGGGGNVFNINFYGVGTESPEDFADKFVNEVEMKLRTT